MKTILIPVDFSDHSVSTYKFAIEIAGTRNQIKLYFHHSFNDQMIIPDPSINSGFDNDTYLNMQLVEEFRKQAEKSMENLKLEVEDYLKQNQLTNFTIETSVTGGDPSWETRNLCDEIIPEFIVMGTQGNGKSEIFEGSMAKKIMNKATTPVIAVPIGETIHSQLNIMYASNSYEKDYAKIQLLKKMFENIPTKIFVVHFHFEGSRDKNLQLINELEEAFALDDKQSISFSLVDTSNKDNAIETFTKEHNINSIAFIAHRSNFFSSLFKDTITKHDFFKLGLPMIALHE